MSIVDVNAIINGTPDKRISNAYQLMKEAYNETSANEFYEVYSKESLFDILNNSWLIFSECFKGLDFYKDIVLNESSCIFSRIPDEIIKVNDYLTEHSSEMDDTQKEKMESLLNDMKAFNERFSDVILIARYLSESEDNIETKISNALYEKNSDAVSSILKESYNDCVTYLYGPFIVANENFTERAAINSIIAESVEASLEGFERYADNAIVMTRLGVSNEYRNSLGNLGNMNSRFIIEAFMDAEPLTKTIANKLTVTPKEAGVVLHEDANDAVNSIFNDIYEATLFEESYDNRRSIANSFTHVAYDKTMALLAFELASIDNKEDIAKGYSLVSENVSFNDAYNELSKYSSMVGDDFFESSDEDDLDSMLDKLSKDAEEDDKDDSKSDAKTVKDKKEQPKKEEPSSASNAKPVKPKAKNLATKVQTAAQDLEVKQMNAYSKMKQKGAEIGRAAKAVATLPMNVINDIKKQINDLHEKDIERRKAYMTEPGYRRKAFRNLKLAIMYGSAAQVKLSLVPTLAIIRHFSKKKDAFVRKELLYELDTEIKVCDAKIEDAANNNDTTEKYRLIRLRDKLNREKFRVMLNSKKM